MTWTERFFLVVSSWVQEMLEYIVEQDHSSRMKVPVLHLILTTSHSVLIPMLLPLQIKISSWIAFTDHTSLKVPLLTIMSFIGHSFLSDGRRVILYDLGEKEGWVECENGSTGVVWWRGLEANLIIYSYFHDVWLILEWISWYSEDNTLHSLLQAIFSKTSSLLYSLL